MSNLKSITELENLARDTKRLGEFTFEKDFNIVDRGLANDTKGTRRHSYMYGLGFDFRRWLPHVCASVEHYVVLDIGSGMGVFCRDAEQLADNIAGFGMTRKLYSPHLRRERIIVGDANLTGLWNLLPDSSVDLVVSNQGLRWISLPGSELLRQLERILTPNGFARLDIKGYSLRVPRNARIDTSRRDEQIISIFNEQTPEYRKFELDRAQYLNRCV